MTDKPIAIDLVPYQDMVMGSKEFLRVWAKEDGPVTCFVNPKALSPDPAAFGVAMVDCIRYAARGWAQALGSSEEEALKRIFEGLDAERANMTPMPTNPVGAGDKSSDEDLGLI